MRTLVTVVLLGLLVSCGSGSGSDDAAVDAGADRATPDVAQDDGSRGDTSAPDAADLATPDVAPESAPEDQGQDPDTTVPDVQPPDVTADEWSAQYGTSCPVTERIGDFELAVKQPVPGTYVGLISGEVWDSVSPQQAKYKEVLSDGGCSVMAGENWLCDPNCTPGFTCLEGQCVLAPAPQSAGTVVISGLTVPMTLEPNYKKAYSYNEPLGLPFDVGSAIELSAAGGDVEAFSLQGHGVAPFETVGKVWSISKGKSTTFEWVPAQGPGKVKLFIDLGQHADVPLYVECICDDTGSVTVPAAVIDKVLGYGLKPMAITPVFRRFTVDSVEVDKGCIEMNVYSSAQGTITHEQ